MTPTPSRHLTVEDIRGKTWRGYIRESTQAQADRGTPPERQKADLLRAATELGLVASEPLWYERTGTGEAQSDELDRALAEAGRYEVLLVLTTSRFARNVTEARRRKAQFAKAGIPIYFVADRILSGTRTSRLLEGVREVMDEDENETRRFWIAGGQRQRQLAGRWIGHIPFGYRKELADQPDGSRTWNGQLRVDPTEAAIVRSIFDDVVSGTAPRDIAYRLNETGVRPRRTQLWTRQQVIRMIRNPVYRGDLVRYRQERPSHYYRHADPHDGHQILLDAVPAIVVKALFDSAGTVLDGRRLPGVTGPSARPYPLSRILRCVRCGHRMSGVFNGYRRYYRCQAKADSGSCTSRVLRAEEAELAVAGWLNSMVLPPDWRTKLAAMTDEDAAADTTRRQGLARRLERLRDLYAWGDLTEVEYRRETKALRGEMAVIVRTNLGATAEIAEALDQLGTTWLADLTPAIPALMLKSLEVEDGRIVEWVARPEMRPLIDLCLLSDPTLKLEPAWATLRFSA